MSDEAPNRQDEGGAYEAERRILLQGVAEALGRIQEKLSGINNNLGVMEQRNREIKGVATVWKESTSSIP